jgi:glycosyltransferase involved in cell wall biosynthesis
MGNAGKMREKVSIIIPTFNRRDYIADAIMSILSQTYDVIEILIIDDGSTDNTKQVIDNIIARNSTNKNIYYYYQNNAGACSARNRGLMLSTGTFIQFMDSDDIIDPEKISKQVEQIMINNTPCAICDFAVVDMMGKIIKKVKNNNDILGYVENFRSVFISSPLIRKDSIPPGLQWDINLKRQQDMDFLFKYFLTIDAWSYTPGFYSKYRMHEGEQISKTYDKGVQYGELVKSMKDYVRYNTNFFTERTRKIAQKYILNLYYHFIISRMKRMIKVILKPLITVRNRGGVLLKNKILPPPWNSCY